MVETAYLPFDSRPDAAPVRLIFRRVMPTPGSQLALFAGYSYHAFITDREGDTLQLEADHRRHAEIENAIRRPEVRYGAQPPAIGTLRRQRSLAGRAGAGTQHRPLDLPHRSGRAGSYDKDPQATLLLIGWTSSLA